MFTSGISLPPFSVNICRRIYGRLAVRFLKLCYIQTEYHYRKSPRRRADRTIWDRLCLSLSASLMWIYIYTLSLFAILINSVILQSSYIENVTSTNRKIKKKLLKKERLKQEKAKLKASRTQG